MKLSYQPKGETTTVTLDGDIDAEIGQIMAQIETHVKTKRVVFDCAGVHKINSVGIKSWIPGIERLKIKFDVSFARCPETFVDLAAMIPAFTSSCVINSYYFAHVCEDCGTEQVQLIEKKLTEPVPPPAEVCGKCGGKLVTAAS